HRLGLQELKNICKWEAVLLGERDVKAVIRRRCLQFEIEAAAEPLAESEAPRLIDATTEWGMDDELHSARFVEEAFGYNCVLGGHGSKHGTALQNVLNDLLGAGIIQATFRFEPGNRFSHHGLRRRKADRRDIGQPIADLLPEGGDLLGQFGCTRRRFTQPEGNSRSGAMCVFDNDAASTALNAANAPGSVTQKHHIAGKAFDGEVLVEGADCRAFGLRYHGVQRSFRDSSAARNCRQAAAAPGAKPSIHLVTMQVGAVTTPARGNSL